MIRNGQRLKTFAWKTPKNTVKEKQLKACSCDTAKGFSWDTGKGLFALDTAKGFHATQLNACSLDTAKGLFVGHS